MARKNSQAAVTPCRALAMPDELMPFSESSFLLPGENLRDFEVVRQMMVDDIQPKTHVEWLWTLDLVDLSWEILRYRQLKKRILDAHRVVAVEAVLQRLNGEGMPPEAMPMVKLQAGREAAEWRDDPKVARDIETRLLQSAYDDIAINAEVFVQAKESFDMFDQLIQRAQSRRIALLREISIRREFAGRVRRV